MSLSNILAAIDAEIATLHQARSLLSSAAPEKKPGRAAKVTAIPAATPQRKLSQKEERELWRR